MRLSLVKERDPLLLAVRERQGLGIVNLIFAVVPCVSYRFPRRSQGTRGARSGEEAETGPPTMSTRRSVHFRRSMRRKCQESCSQLLTPSIDEPDKAVKKTHNSLGSYSGQEMEKHNVTMALVLVHVVTNARAGHHSPRAGDHAVRILTKLAPTMKPRACTWRKFQNPQSSCLTTSILFSKMQRILYKSAIVNPIAELYCVHEEPTCMQPLEETGRRSPWESPLRSRGP